MKIRDFSNTIKLAAPHLAGSSCVPFSIIHFVTNRCNLRCKHCFIYGDFENKETEKFDVPEELGFSEIEKLTRSMKGRLAVVSLTGGEPLLREDLPDIARAYVDNAGARLVEVATNGWFCDKLEKFVKGFLDATEAQLYISISFDGMRQRHDNNRGREGAFDKAVEAAKLIRSVSNKRLQLSATLTVCDQPTDEMTELFDFLVDDIKVDTVVTAALRGRPLDAGKIGFNLECYRKLNDLIRNRVVSRKLSAFSNAPGGDMIKAASILSRRRAEQTIAENHFICPCVAGRTLVVIYADGSVYPCEMLNQKMGDLCESNMDLCAVMRSQRAKQVRKYIRCSRCFCSFECAWTYNVIFQHRNWAGLLAEYMKLKTGKKPKK